MFDLYKMKKSDLIDKCRELLDENENLQKQIDDLNDYYSEMENELAKKINELDRNDYIKDMKWFKWRLQCDNLLTSEMEDFIEDYLRYNNVICEW